MEEFAEDVARDGRVLRIESSAVCWARSICSCLIAGAMEPDEGEFPIVEGHEEAGKVDVEGVEAAEADKEGDWAEYVSDGLVSLA